MASNGQLRLQVPHSTHSVTSMTDWVSPSLMASLSHPTMHAPHWLHSPVTTNGIPSHSLGIREPLQPIPCTCVPGQSARGSSAAARASGARSTGWDPGTRREAHRAAHVVQRVARVDGRTIISRVCGWKPKMALSVITRLGPPRRPACAAAAALAVSGAGDEGIPLFQLARLMAHDDDGSGRRKRCRSRRRYRRSDGTCHAAAKQGCVQIAVASVSSPPRKPTSTQPLTEQSRACPRNCSGSWHGTRPADPPAQPGVDRLGVNDAQLKEDRDVSAHGSVWRGTWRPPAGPIPRPPPRHPSALALPRPP